VAGLRELGDRLLTRLTYQAENKGLGENPLIFAKLFHYY
jgi:hypothetical protein